MAYTPSKQALETLFSDEISNTREWVEDQLLAKAELTYDNHHGIYLEELEWDKNSVETYVSESSQCSCCSDDTLGRISMSVDELITLLDHDESLAKIVAAKKKAEAEARDAKRIEAEKARKIQQEQAERKELQRLQAKYCG